MRCFPQTEYYELVSLSVFTSTYLISKSLWRILVMFSVWDLHSSLFRLANFSPGRGPNILIWSLLHCHMNLKSAVRTSRVTIFDLFSSKQFWRIDAVVIVGVLGLAGPGGHTLAGITVSNTAGTWMFCLLLALYVGPLRRADHSSRAVLPTVFTSLKKG